MSAVNGVIQDWLQNSPLQFFHKLLIIKICFEYACNVKSSVCVLFFYNAFLLLFIYHHHHKDKLNSQIIIKIFIQALVFVVPNVYMKKVRVSLALRGTSLGTGNQISGYGKIGYLASSTHHLASNKRILCTKQRERIICNLVRFKSWFSTPSSFVNMVNTMYSKGVFTRRRASPSKRAGFHLAFTWEKPALLPGLSTFNSPRNPQSDICILYPTHKQTELVKRKII